MPIYISQAASAASSGTTISSVTTVEMLALTGTDGQIVYNTSYGQHFRWSIDRWTPFGTIPIRKGYLLEDDFIGTNAAAPMGQLSWSVGGNAATLNNSAADHPGVAGLNTAAGSTRSALHLRSDSMYFDANADHFQEWIIKTPSALSDATDEYSVAFGFHDVTTYSATGQAVDGAYFIYDRATHGTTWQAKTAANSVTTTTDTAITFSANTWVRLGILVKGVTSVEFFINGVSVATITTNIPSGASRPTGPNAVMNRSAGTASRNCGIDVFRQWGFFTTARSS